MWLCKAVNTELIFPVGLAGPECSTVGGKHRDRKDQRKKSEKSELRIRAEPRFSSFDSCKSAYLRLAAPCFSPVAALILTDYFITPNSLLFPQRLRFKASPKKNFIILNPHDVNCYSTLKHQSQKTYQHVFDSFLSHKPEFPNFFDPVLTSHISVDHKDILFNNNFFSMFFSAVFQILAGISSLSDNLIFLTRIKTLF